MPELPEVETTKTSLLPLIGQTVSEVYVYQPKLRERMPDDLSKLAHHRLISVTRRAKYLLLEFEQLDTKASKTLLVHLGMSGSLQQYPVMDTPIAKKHDHLIIVFDDGTQKTAVHYHDPRRFGIIAWADNDEFIDNKDTARQRYLNHLGVEPLQGEFNAQYLYSAIHRQHSKNKTPIKKPIKSVIMEQTIVVGVGNIYAAESLFLSGIHPATSACLLSMTQIERLVDNIKQVLARSIEQGGSTLKDFVTGQGKTGYFQQTLLVYGNANKPCYHCHTPIETLKINGRASAYCPKCQPLQLTTQT